MTQISYKFEIVHFTVSGVAKNLSALMQMNLATPTLEKNIIKK